MRPDDSRMPPRCSTGWPSNSDRFRPFSRPALRLAGSCQWQHLMLSLIRKGEPDGQEQTEIKIEQDRTQIVSHGKTPRQKQRPRSTEAHRCIKCRRFKSGIIEINCVFVIQTVGCAE